MREYSCSWLRYTTALFVLSFILLNQPLGLQAKEALTMPTGTILLTVDGMIGNTNDGATAVLDRDMLEQLGTHQRTIKHPYHEEEIHFEGILFSDLLKLLKSNGKTVIAQGVDGYTASIPVEDLENYPVMIALKRDGRYMRVRTKGPLWVVYPMDEHPHLSEDVYVRRGLWQLVKMSVQ